MDAAPQIIGEALIGAFNTSKKRNNAYKKYFNKLNKEYYYRYNLLKSLIMGLSSIEDENLKRKINKRVRKINKDGALLLENGIKDVDIINDLEPEAGFFVVIDFTKLKNKMYENFMIKTEEDLVTSILFENKIKIFNWKINFLAK